MSKINITTLETKALVALYNELSGKAIKKFSDRLTGEKQVQKLLDAKDAAEAEQRKIEAEKAKEAAKSAPKPKAGKKTRAPKKIPTDLEERAAADLIKSYKAGECSCPACGTTKAASIKPAGKEGSVPGDERSFCTECKSEFWNETGKPFARRNPGRDAGAGIAASWSDAAVREARSARHNVVVDGEEYRSVREAFVALRLPLNKHIKFRMLLKEKGKATFQTFYASGDVKKEFVFKIAK